YPTPARAWLHPAESGFGNSGVGCGETPCQSPSRTHLACPTSTPQRAWPSARPTDGPRRSHAAPLQWRSTEGAPQTTPACASARGPHITFHGLFPVASRRSSAPTTRYRGRRPLTARDPAAGPPAWFGSGPDRTRAHRRTTGYDRCPVIPPAVEPPTNGGQGGDAPASTTHPNLYTSGAC